MSTATTPRPHLKSQTADVVAVLRAENAGLRRRVSQLHAAQQASARDLAQLRRQLAHAWEENARLHTERRAPATTLPSARARRLQALSEPWSRSP